MGISDLNWNQNADQWNLTNSPTSSYEIEWMIYGQCCICIRIQYWWKFKETQFGSFDSIWPRKRRHGSAMGFYLEILIQLHTLWQLMFVFTFRSLLLVFALGPLFDFRSDVVFFHIQSLLRFWWNETLAKYTWWCVYWNGETYNIGCYDAWNLIMTISPIELHWIINLGTRSSIEMNTKKILLINKQKTCACQVVCFPNSTHQVKWSVLERLCVSIFLFFFVIPFSLSFFSSILIFHYFSLSLPLSPSLSLSLSYSLILRTFMNRLAKYAYEFSLFSGWAAFN